MTIANIEKTTKMSSLRSKKTIDWRELFFKNLFMLSAALGILSLITIAYFIFREGIDAFRYAGVSGIVLGSDWLPPALYGIAPMIVASLVSTAGAVILGVPIGVLTAIFIAEVALSV